MAERRPRVLIVVTLAETGGAQSYVARLVPALTARFEVVVAAHGDGPLRARVEAAGARFVALRHVRRALSPARDLLGLVELVRISRRLRPAVVHANSSKAGVLAPLAATLARVPVRIFTVHGWAFAAHSGTAARLYLWADRLTCPLTTLVICVSEGGRASGLRARTCRADRTVVIPNPAPALVAPRRDGRPGAARIVSVGRLKQPKDPLTLVRALALLEPGSFDAVIAGDGPERARVADEARRRGVGAALALPGEREDVPALLAAADVFVLSSASEGLPMSILEAMAAGLPVVASRVGGVPELVEDGTTGLLVPPGDAAALATALRRLISDPALRARLGEAGRRRARSRFDLAGFRRAHLRAYLDALARAGVPVEP